MHDDRPERERYQHTSLLDQVRDELETLWRHPKVLLILVIVLGGFVLFRVIEPEVVQVEDLRAGDCIYIPTTSSSDVGAAYPIGPAVEFVSGLYRAGAQRASCDASHSQEVAAAFLFDEVYGAPYPGTGGLTDRKRAACEAAFEALVGRPPDGSQLALTIAVPGEEAWAAGRRGGACLVHNADGTFLGSRAAGSGR